MITLTGAKRRAEEFAAAVDAPSSTPPRRDLAELVDVVTTLRAHPTDDATPRAEFSAALRGRLLREAEASWTYDPSATRLSLPTRRTGRRERRLAVAATALVLTGGTAGMAAASQQALPGEALYPIKRGLEDVRTDLASDEAAKGRTLLDQATNRLTEAQALVEADEADAVVGETIETFRAQAVAGSGLLLDSYAESGEEAAVVDVRAFTQDGLAGLEDLADGLPADLQGPVQEAALTLRGIERQAVRACPTCGSGEDLAPVSSAFKPAVDAARALAALRGESVGNDHPLISNRMSPEPRREGGRQAGGGSKGGGDDSGSAGGPTGDVPDAGDVESDLPRLELPELDANGPDAPDVLGGAGDSVRKGVEDVGKQVDKATGGAGKKATDEVKKTVDKVGDTVEDTVGDVTDPLRDPRLP